MGIYHGQRAASRCGLWFGGTSPPPTHVRVVLHETGADLGALGVESNGDGAAGGQLGGGGAGIVNDRLVVRVFAVGEVHADCGGSAGEVRIHVRGRLQRTDVQSALHELDEGLDIVGLGTDRADDGGLRECERELGGWKPDWEPPRTHLAEELLVIGKVVETGLEACEPGELRGHCVLQDQSLGGDVVMQGRMVVAATETVVVIVAVTVTVDM